MLRASSTADEPVIDLCITTFIILYCNKIQTGDKEEEMEPLTPSARTTLRRLPERGSFERARVRGILDEGLVCHVGFMAEHGPVVIPTTYARVEDLLYLHGSPASRMLRALRTGVETCVTVTLLDGLVLARSAFHHSMNYRSVVIFGIAREVTDAAEKLAALRALVEHVVPGRWDDTRAPSARELARTAVLALPLDEASVKHRAGPPADDDEDYALDHWAGVVPLCLEAASPIGDPKLRDGIPCPSYWRSSTSSGRGRCLASRPRT
jgi:nitroimidazol reductase NimA-like FMN-containing flavoprotein (pyridoxamine 5'-phosphate oxidase superfamily)